MRVNKKKEHILDAAEALMCGIPDKDISVEMIAGKAGIAKGSIYYYFNSKDDIVNAVIERSYATAINEYFADSNDASDPLSKIKSLFRSVLRQEFCDKRKNIIVYFHVQENPVLRMKMMMTAVRTISPILAKLLAEGAEQGCIRADFPEEGSEMIIAMLTFLLDRSFFPSDSEGIYRKLKLYANVLETCMQAEKGSFDFLYSSEEAAEFMKD